jgi:hypothetical protein
MSSKVRLPKESIIGRDLCMIAIRTVSRGISLQSAALLAVSAALVTLVDRGQLIRSLPSFKGYAHESGAGTVHE